MVNRANTPISEVLNSPEIPAGWFLDYEWVVQDVPFGKGRAHPRIDHPFKAISKVLADSDDIDYGLFVKELYGLHKRPDGFRMSVIVFKICQEQDSKRLAEAYPQFIKPTATRKTLPLTDRAIFKQFQDASDGMRTWEEEVKKSINEYYFKRVGRVNKNSKPIVVLIKYGECGFYCKPSTTEFSRFADFYHYPKLDDEYHKVLWNVPPVFSADCDIENFIDELVTKVNQYAERKCLDADTLCDLWECFMKVHLSSRFGMGTDAGKLIKFLKQHIEQYHPKVTLRKSPEADFYLRNCVDFLDALAQDSSLKRCPVCDMPFIRDIEKKKYCSLKCAKRPRNQSNYRNRKSRKAAQS